MKYKIKTFFKKLRRALDWALFIYKQPPWQDYSVLLGILEKELLSMSEYFATKGHFENDEQDAKRMKLAAKLIRMFMEEHYHHEYLKDAFIQTGDDMLDMDWTPGKSLEGSIASSNKDLKALSLGMRIVAQNCRGWWQ